MARLPDDSPNLSVQSFKRSPKEIRDALRALVKNANRNFSRVMRRMVKEPSRTRKRAF